LQEIKEAIVFKRENLSPEAKTALIVSTICFEYKCLPSAVFSENAEYIDWLAAYLEARNDLQKRQSRQ